MTLPLAGITIAELGHSVAAPFAGQVLGDLGARVVKVENPAQGDDARAWGPPFWEGTSATFQSLNRNKLSVAVDLKDEAERARLRGFLVGECDVVLQNLRPGLVARYGLDERLRDENPRLVYCNMGAYGSKGPMASLPGYDPLMQAFGGIMSVTGEADRPPVRVGPSIVDMGTGLWAVIGILAALQKRGADGAGCTVDTSLFECSLSWMTVHAALGAASGREPGKSGSEVAMIAPYKAYLAADRWLVIAAGNDGLFARLCGVLGRPDWVADERFATNAARVRNRVALNEGIDALVRAKPRDHWLARLTEAGVPAAPLQTIGEALDHPQAKALGMVHGGEGGGIPFMGLPLRFDGERPPMRAAPPALGADTAAVLGPRTGKDPR